MCLRSKSQARVRARMRVNLRSPTHSYYFLGNIMPKKKDKKGKGKGKKAGKDEEEKETEKKAFEAPDCTTKELVLQKESVHTLALDNCLLLSFSQAE